MKTRAAYNLLGYVGGVVSSCIIIDAKNTLSLSTAETVFWFLVGLLLTCLYAALASWTLRNLT